eukprot:m.522903 g.522903  ORF g.522903 m.522903 type:complete len:146 (-) comp21972_c0_seq2:951-1388(-)
MKKYASARNMPVTVSCPQSPQSSAARLEIRFQNCVAHPVSTHTREHALLHTNTLDPCHRQAYGWGELHKYTSHDQAQLPWVSPRRNPHPYDAWHVLDSVHNGSIHQYSTPDVADHRTSATAKLHHKQYTILMLVMPQGGMSWSKF